MIKFEGEDFAANIALSGYFEGASPDKSWNLRLAMPIIQTFGARSVFDGLAWIVNDINQMSSWTVSKAFSIPGDTLNNIVVARLMKSMGRMHDFMEACGSSGQRWLLNSLAHYQEDVRALAAYLLADNMWKLDSDEKINRVKHAYNSTQGTSCKIALSLALFMAGDRQLLRYYIAKGIFGNRQKYQYFERLSDQYDPNSSKNDKEMTIILLMVVPEVLGADNRNAGLIKMLALDIESNGQSCRAVLDWKRKQYPE